MTKAGFKLSGARDCPISPVMLGDARLASEIADAMLDKGDLTHSSTHLLTHSLTHSYSLTYLGIYVIGFSYPVVPKGAARIRVQLSAAHSTEQVQKAIDAFVEVGRAKKVIQ